MNAPSRIPGPLAGELVVDSFAGGGGTSEGIRQAIGRDPDIAINHDALALAMHRVNHPGTHHMVEDVWHVDALGMCDGRPIGLLWLSPDCFPAGTLVLTAKGYRPIETVQVGEQVLTHCGRWRAVTETSRAKRSLITLRGHGHPGLSVSPEHPFYARQRSLRWDNDLRRDVPVFSDPEWMPASAMSPGSYRYTYDNGRRAGLEGGSYWGSPTFFPVLDIPGIGGRSHPIDADAMWLAGRYLGDGWTRLTEQRGELVITCGKHEADRLRVLLGRWWRGGVRAVGGELAWHERSTSTAYQFSTNHRGLVTWLREEFGHRAEAKGLPAWALGMAVELRQALLEGYLSADGHRKANRVECTTVSKALAFGLKALASSLGYAPTVYLGRNTTEVGGRVVNSRPAWHVRWRAVLERRQVVDHDGIRWSPIRERTEAGGEAEVFNIGVEEDESYVVEGIVVHNCKHFSKAKGGKPREKAIRGLAWVGLRWVKSLPKRQRPRVVILENVEEFQFWGPLLDDGKPCPVQKGATFKAFIAAFEALGYAAEWRELRACDYGDPTIRKRLFVILRRDGLPITWPARTHGNPKDAGDAVLIAAGLLLPWRTAAEIIDFTLPCPSIFETSAEIKASLGLRAQRPLRPNTLSRVAKGTMRYVVNASRPFIVPITHGGDARVHAVDEPLRTITTANRGEHALITPFVTKFNRGATGHAIDEPLATVTAHASATHGGGAAPLGVVTPVLINVANGKTSGRGPNTWSVEEPSRTITTAGGQALVAPLLVRTAHGEVDRAGRRRGRGEHDLAEPMPTVLASNDAALVAPILVGCGGRAGQSRPRPADEPVLSQTAKADACVVAPFLVPRYQEKDGHEPRVRSVELPSATVMPRGNEGVLAAVHLSMLRNSDKPYSAADNPARTVTAGGDGKTAVVAAFLAQHNGSRQADGIAPGSPVDRPVSTITAAGSNQALVQASFLSHAYTSNTAGGNGDLERPLKTTLAGGQHASLVAAFLAKYYGAGEPVQAADDPLHTVTAKPRHGLVTVTLAGESYVITDIGMRMLTPRERFSAQGFRPDYVIDHGLLEDGSRVAFTLEQQGRMCGNSVCPGIARALVGVNFAAMPRARRALPPSALPLLQAAE